ncbi:MAG: hypothetical protein ACHBNF_01780 [Chromatiales bacterium]
MLNFIAEYLAAYYLLERNGSSETLWRKFLAQVDSRQNASAQVKPFLSAVLDCLLTGEIRYEVSGFVRMELAKRLEIDVTSPVPADVEKAPVANEASQRTQRSRTQRIRASERRAEPSYALAGDYGFWNDGSAGGACLAQSATRCVKGKARGGALFSPHFSPMCRYMG